MGRVHEAVHEPTGREVALKLVREGASARACARLLREARAARAAAGEHVVEVLDAGVGDDGLPFVAMERLDGDDLGAVLRREGRLELGVALALVDRLLRGLERVHGGGVVHRDLKPENVVLLGCREGAPPAADVAIKIVDFGVSKVRTGGVLVPGSLTREGVVLGTPLYMSPEQAQGLPDVDERSDLWSVGAILYQCLAGRSPHAGATYEQIVVAVCTSDAPDVRRFNPAVPAPIADVLARALSRDRRRRFRDARGMREALERAAAGDAGAAAHDETTLAGVVDQPASRPGATAAMPLVRRRRRPRARAVIVGLASMLTGGVMALIGLRAVGLDAPASVGAVPRSSGTPSGTVAGALPPVEVAVDASGPSALDAGEAPSADRADAPVRAAPPPAPSAERRSRNVGPGPAVPRAPKRGVAAGLELRER
jgi:serine/threonine-protein kinase